MVPPAFIILPIVSVSIFIAILVLDIICRHRVSDGKIDSGGGTCVGGTYGGGQIDVVIVDGDNMDVDTSTNAGDGAVRTGGDWGFSGNSGWGYDAGGGGGGGFSGGGGCDGGGGSGFGGGGGYHTGGCGGGGTSGY